MLDAIGIVSGNLEQSIRFYQVLGIELKQAGGPEHFEALTPSGIRLMLDSVSMIQSIHPDWKKPQGSGIALCFRQGSPEAVDRTYEKVVQAGFKGTKAPWDAFWGQRYACVSDPDGNPIDLFAAL